MDEMWQRHKTFILQVIVGGVLFLVAYLVMRSMYGDADDPAVASARNKTRKEQLESKIAALHAPSASSIAEQKAIADRAEAQKWELARRVASVPGRDPKASDADREKAYVRENFAWVLRNIQKPDEGYVDQYDRVPQAAISRLRDAARSVLVGRAAQSGKELDETLGLAQGFPEDELPEALHGLAIITDVVSRCLARPGIDRIQNIRITPHSQFPSQGLEVPATFMTGMTVHLEMVGSPADILDVLRSFNAVDKKDQRMIVLESIEYIVPLSADEDTVKAAINIAGLRYQSGKTEAN